jgi:hypothetical protein
MSWWIAALVGGGYGLKPAAARSAQSMERVEALDFSGRRRNHGPAVSCCSSGFHARMDRVHVRICVIVAPNSMDVPNPAAILEGTTASNLFVHAPHDFALGINSSRLGL